MSLQDSTKDKSKLGDLVQQMIDNSPHIDDHTEIHVHYNNGVWYVTRDHKFMNTD